jgi:hypothetical protein
MTSFANPQLNLLENALTSLRATPLTIAKIFYLHDRFWMKLLFDNEEVQLC